MAQTNATPLDRIKDLRDLLPNDSHTAIAIDRGAPTAIVRMFASSEGFNDLANALFDVQYGPVNEGPVSSDESLARLDFNGAAVRRGFGGELKTE